MSDYSRGGYQYKHRALQEPRYYDSTVWTAPGELYGNEWVLGNDNAGMYQYNENPHGLF